MPINVSEMLFTKRLSKRTNITLLSNMSYVRNHLGPTHSEES